MPSDNMAELPVTPATMNLVTAIAEFDAMAAYMAALDSLMLDGTDGGVRIRCARAVPWDLLLFDLLGHAGLSCDASIPVSVKRFVTM